MCLIQLVLYVLVLAAVSLTWGFPHAKGWGRGHPFHPLREMRLWSPFIGEWDKARDFWFMYFLNRLPSSKKPYHLDVVLFEGTAIPCLGF